MAHHGGFHAKELSFVARKRIAWRDRGLIERRLDHYGLQGWRAPGCRVASDESIP